MPTCCTFYHGAGAKCPKHDKEPVSHLPKKYRFNPNPLIGRKTEIDKQCKCICHLAGHHFCLNCMNSHSVSVSRESKVRPGLRGHTTSQAPSFRSKYYNRY
jgi:hypothetical protein